MPHGSHARWIKSKKKVNLNLFSLQVSLWLQWASWDTTWCTTRCPTCSSNKTCSRDISNMDTNVLKTGAKSDAGDIWHLGGGESGCDSRLDFFNPLPLQLRCRHTKIPIWDSHNNRLDTIWQDIRANTGLGSTLFCTSRKESNQPTNQESSSNRNYFI